MSDELHDRIQRDTWMLRDVDTCFESIGRTRDSVVRRCKLCDEDVSLWKREVHLRAHQRTLQTIKRRAEYRRAEVARRALAKNRKIGGTNGQTEDR